MRTRCPTNPSWDLVPTQGGAVLGLYGEPRRLAEAQELIVDEAVFHAVELVDICDDGQALILHKFLNKRVSAEGIS